MRDDRRSKAKAILRTHTERNISLHLEFLFVWFTFIL